MIVIFGNKWKNNCEFFVAKGKIKMGVLIS
jgi:hypothetical protein